MKVFRITRCKHIEDFSGYGAANYPGRWNGIGTHVLYTASTGSLAMLEILVHLNQIPVQDFCVVCLEIPENAVFTYDQKLLPQSWSDYPSPNSLKKVGDQFVQKGEYLAMRLPSSIFREDEVVLLNPNHKEFKAVSIVYTRPIDIDRRLLKMK
jgi:RES domain-containing protein